MAHVVAPAGRLHTLGTVGICFPPPQPTERSIDALARGGAWKMLTIYDSKTLVSLSLADLSAVFDISDSSSCNTFAWPRLQCFAYLPASGRAFSVLQELLSFFVSFEKPLG